MAAVDTMMTTATVFNPMKQTTLVIIDHKDDDEREEGEPSASPTTTTTTSGIDATTTGSINNNVQPTSPSTNSPYWQVPEPITTTTLSPSKNAPTPEPSPSLSPPNDNNINNTYWQIPNHPTSDDNPTSAPPSPTATTSTANDPYSPFNDNNLHMNTTTTTTSANNTANKLIPNDDDDDGQSSSCSWVCDGDNINLTSTAPQHEQQQQNTTAIRRLRFLTTEWGAWVAPYARKFEAKMNHLVQIELVEVSFASLYPDIINEAQSQTGLYDGFITPPSVAGSVVEYQGWKDLTPFIQQSSDRIQDWADIMLGYRQYIAQYQEQIIMYPLDGDILSLYYRKDVLEAFNLTVPRTWEEYGTVAATVHGQHYQNQTLIGSCVGRVRGCAGAYWVTLLLSTMTQYQGHWSGHLFDTSTLQPLTGKAMEQALEWMEMQVLHGADNEFEGCINNVNMDHMINDDADGTSCVLSYNWGDTFKEHLREGSQFRRDDNKKLGVAPAPGSTKVLNRDTMELVDCDSKETCPYAIYYDDIGWVNQAPYLAFGGWACAVNNYATQPANQNLAMEFCAYASSLEASMDSVIPNATGPEVSFSGADPFRVSHMQNGDRYVEQGYDQETTDEYLQAILAGLNSNNVVTDIRFPTANEIDAVLDNAFHDHLNLTKHGLIPEVERAMARARVAEQVTSQWQEIIARHDSEETATYSILESYQRLRGVYVDANIDLNQLGKVRWFGIALASVVMLSSIGCAIWTIVYKKTRVVRASQPLFLVMICFGTFLLGSSIVLLAIDDGVASEQVCSGVCMAIPWFLTMGWVTVFAALQSKLQRVNRIFTNAKKFRRVKVDKTDVLTVFVCLFSLNFVVLLTWTLVNPIEWERSMSGELQSYGDCHFDIESTSSKVFVCLVSIINGVALILANLEAYKARNVSTEYGESKYIGMATASISQALLVVLPLYFLMDDNPSALFFLQASFIFILAMAINLLIFVPKIHAWRSRQLVRGTAVTMSNSSETGGLAIRIVNTDVFAKEGDDRIQEYERKLANLSRLLEVSGFNSDLLYREAGLPSREYLDSRSPGAAIALSSDERAPADASNDGKPSTIASFAEEPNH